MRSALMLRLTLALAAGILRPVLPAASGADSVKATPVSFKAGTRAHLTELPPSETQIQLAKPNRSPTSPKPEFIANPGIAAGDFDGDGWCDLFVCSLDGNSALLRNLGGWKFTNATAAAELTVEGRALYGATFADVNGDGALDLIGLSLTETNSLFLNNGNGAFTEAGDFPWVFDPQGGNISAALADIDGDGDLDLYVTGYAQQRFKDVIAPEVYQRLIADELARLRAGLDPDPAIARHFEILPFSTPGGLDYYIGEKAIADSLYVNDGDGGFTPSTEANSRFRDPEGRVSPLPSDWGLGCAFRDMNLDGQPDLYVCNDFLSQDRFWVNDGEGIFHPLAGLGVRHTPRFSMGLDSADINRDGLPDFLTLDMLSRNHARRIVQAGMVAPAPILQGTVTMRPQYMQNSLFVSRGDGTYVEIAAFAGVKASEWSWAALFFDADLDGYDDLLITTGMERDFMDTDVANKVRQMGEMSAEQRRMTRSMYARLHTRNQLFRNRADLTFEEVGLQWGMDRSAVSGGVAAADFDNDGDLDIAINNSDGPPEIYRNDADGSRIAVRLRGRTPNTQGIGSRIFLRHGAIPEQSAEVISGGIYASGCDPLRVFACGSKADGMEIEVRWRSGKTTVLRDVRANHIYDISEPQ